jgi:hypothetical protein
MDTNTQTTETPVKAKREAVDLAQLQSGMFQELAGVTPGVNAFEVSAPVPSGKYVLGLAPSSDPKKPFVEKISFEENKETGKPATTIFYVNTVLKIVQPFADPNNPGATVNPEALKGRILTFERAFSSRKKEIQGQQTSEIATLLEMFGVDMKSQLTDKTKTSDLVATLVQIISSGQARIGGTVSWKSGWVDGEGKNDRGYDNPGHFEVIGETNWPLDNKGNRIPILLREGKEYRAKAYLNRELFSVQGQR